MKYIKELVFLMLMPMPSLLQSTIYLTNKSGSPIWVRIFCWDSKFPSWPGGIGFSVLNPANTVSWQCGGNGLGYIETASCAGKVSPTSEFNDSGGTIPYYFDSDGYIYYDKIRNPDVKCPWAENRQTNSIGQCRLYHLGN